MILTLDRDQFDSDCTLGQLSVDEQYECWTLEDPWREPGVKVDGDTCIPAGRYEVAWTFSDRFKMFMPLLLDVSMFTGIRIHPGNRAVDTRGCLLVGASRSEHAIARSRDAYNALAPKIKTACAAGKVFIDVLDTFK